MAWKVHGVFNAGGNSWDSYRKGDVYGPLPIKRWVPKAGEKRHRVSYRAPKAYVGNSPSSTRDYTAQRAVLYARWLAKRDGKVIPSDCTAVACWSQVDVPGKARPEPRVFGVTWQNKSRALLHIDIPHWDWVPQVTEETLPDNVVSFANSLTPAQACRLIQVADPLTPEEELMFSVMSDDDLVTALEA
jgi:hypothetical protein